MELEFTKMHGCGNDYIYFDCFRQKIEDPEALAVKLSDRHFGIGGDGIVLICPSDVADAKMRMFNADGSEGKMCGNAIRCIGKYIYESGIAHKDIVTVETLSGIKTLYLTVDKGIVTMVRVNMGKAILVPADIPCRLPGERAINITTAVAGREYTINAVSMGNPHCVLFTNGWKDFDIDSFDIEHIGPKFENDVLFPERVNTEFALVDKKAKLIKMRVWERGSGETWACGTGACATAVAAVENGFFAKGEDITLSLRGGNLIIRYTDEAVYMTGPAEIAFTGKVSI